MESPALGSHRLAAAGTRRAGSEPAVEPAPSTLPEALRRAAGRAGMGARFVDRRENLRLVPWAELWQRAEEACGRLQNAGVQPDDRVVVVMATSVESLAALYGAQLAGAVPVPIGPLLRPGGRGEYVRRTTAMIAQVGACLLVAEPAVRGPLELAARPELGCRSLSEMEPGRSRPEAPAPERLALIQFSSGTTAEPKPVELTHRAVTAQARLIEGLWMDSEEVRHAGVSWLPLYHDMGLIGGLLPAVEAGGDVTLIPPEVFLARPAIWLRTISRQAATISVAPNFAYAHCVRRVDDGDLEGVDLSSWRLAFVGAESVSPSVLRGFNDRFARWGLRRQAATPAYGLSEAGLAVTVSAIGSPFVSRRFDRQRLAQGVAEPSTDGQELVSNGAALPGFELSIRSADGVDLAERQVGRLWVRGPSLMRGYFGAPEATSRALRAGWLDTGDLGFLDRGELFLTGRAKDVLIVRGGNYSPDIVERAVREVPGVLGSGAVAGTFLPDGGEQEQLHLLVEVDRGTTAEDRQRLAERCHKAVLAATGLSVDEFVAVRLGSLPRTSSGKIRRQEAMRRFREGRLPAP